MHSSILHPRSSFRRRGFTLTEVLVVVAVLVLLLGVSVPLFKAMTGNRSVDAASNVIAAAIADARAEAIAFQKPAGLFFYLDRATLRVQAIPVRANDAFTIGSGTAARTVHFLDIIPDREPYALPPNVGLQVLDNCEVINGVRQDDGYIGMNPPPFNAPSDNFRYSGVILFDPRGQLVSLPYGFQLTSPSNSSILTEMGKLFTDRIDGTSGGTDPFFVPPNTTSASGSAVDAPLSQFGFILYDAEAFRTFPGSTETDTDIIGGSYTSGEQREESDFFDPNGLPFLVNRYTGALTRGE